MLMADFDLEGVYRAILDGQHDPAKLWHRLDAPNREVHAIPVPAGWSVEQAWEAISRGDELTNPDPEWAVVEVKANRMVRWYPANRGKR